MEERERARGRERGRSRLAQKKKGKLKNQCSALNAHYSYGIAATPRPTSLPLGQVCGHKNHIKSI